MAARGAHSGSGHFAKGMSGFTSEPIICDDLFLQSYKEEQGFTRLDRNGLKRNNLEILGHPKILVSYLSKYSI